MVMAFDNPIVVQSITATPSSPRHGDLVVFSMRVATLGYQPFTVPCWFEIDGERTPVEQRTSVPVSNTMEVHSSWIAFAGSHAVAGCAGPQGSDRRLLDNRATLQLDVGVPTGNHWLEDWKDATRRGVKSWFSGSRVHGGTVEGSIGRLTAGALSSGRSVYETMLARLLELGEPAAIAAAVSHAVDKSWRSWFEGYSVSLTYDPSFTVCALPYHPPAPNIVPAPLASGGSSHGGELLPDGLATRLREDLRSLAAGLSNDIDAFASWLAIRFGLWLSTTVLINVMASGPVPSYAPPYALIGPVMGGSLDSSSGILSDHGAFDVG